MKNNIEAVIFDWAGTVVDFGSFAPTQIFVQAFKEAYDFDISLAEARGPMGMGKIDHIRALLNEPTISQRWLSSSVPLLRKNRHKKFTPPSCHCKLSRLRNSQTQLKER